MYSMPQGGRYPPAQQPYGQPFQNQYQQYQQPPSQGRGSQYGQPQNFVGKNISLPQPPSLIQPPALNTQENVNTNSQFLAQRGPLNVSNNQHSEFEGYNQQQEEEGWNQGEHIASVFWEQRCITMLDRFQWFFQRFQILREEYVSLSEEMQKMDSEDQWHHFQQHHDQFHEKIIEMQQELAAVVGENQQLLQQKMTHDSESVWEQRYQELLGNFKSLQEEMAHMESEGKGTGGVPPEHYQQLQDQYNELEYQYGEAIKEIQKNQGGFEYQEQLQLQINEYRQEIDSYKNNFSNLHNQNVQLQNMIVDLQNQNHSLGQQVKLAANQQKIQQLLSVIQEKQRQIENLQQQFESRNNSEMEQAIHQKNIEISELKKLLAQKDQQKEKEVRKLETAISKAEKQKKQLDYQIQKLEEKISDLNRASIKGSESTVKIQSLEKKLNYANQEITNLTDTLKNKNQELTQLRSISYEVERLRDIQKNYSFVVEQRDKLSQNLRKKHGQIDSMHKQIESMALKIQQISNKRQQYSTRNLLSQIEDLNDHIRRSEGEISKLKNIIDLKQDYTLKMEEEIRKLNDKFIMTEQTLAMERDVWKQKELKLNSKNIDHEKRLKNLDYQFNVQIKQTLQKQVKTLRKQISEKQDIIRQMQEKQIVLSSKLAVFEKQKGNFDYDLSIMKKKEKELESLNQAQTRRYKELQSAFSQKEEQMDQLKLKFVSLNSQLNLAKGKQEQLNGILKQKVIKIEELQKQMIEYLGKSEVADRLKNQNGKLKIALEAAQEQNDKLRVNGQSRIGYSKVVASNVRLDTQKQENVVILDLQKQNKYLKEEMAKMLEKYIEKKAEINESGKKQSHEAGKKQQYQDRGLMNVDLNRRLNQFNIKLQSAIKDQGMQHSKSQQMVLFWQQQRRQLVEKYEGQINYLKRLIKQQTISQNSQVTQNSQLESPKKKTYLGMEYEKNKQQCQFYKTKNKELEQRTQNLIRINEQLRGKIDGVLTLKQNTTTADYYKQQYKQIEGDYESLKLKLKKIVEQNKEIKVELFSKKSKLTQQYQYKILQLELTIQDLKRKVALFQAGTPKQKQITSLPSKYDIDLGVSNVEKKSNYQKRESYKNITYPDSLKKYQGIQQEFQSVLGNFRNEGLRNYEKYGGSVNLSSYSYGESRIDVQRG